jgi:hypothetical protein
MKTINQTELAAGSQQAAPVEPGVEAREMKTINQTELALLAATLARGNDDATLLCRRAFELWEASGKELHLQKQLAEKRQQDEWKRKQDEREQASTPPAFDKWNDAGGEQGEFKPPMTLDQFLCVTLPKLAGKEGERMKRYRRFHASRCQGKHPDETQSQYEERQLNYVQREVEEAKAKGFNATTYQQEARAFLRWEYDRAEKAKSDRGRKGAEALKAKREAEKKMNGGA